MEIGVKFRAEFEQRLKSDFDQNVIRGPIDHAPKKLNDDERKAEHQDCESNVAKPRRLQIGQLDVVTQELIDDDFERPRLKQV